MGEDVLQWLRERHAGEFMVTGDTKAHLFYGDIYCIPCNQDFNADRVRVEKHFASKKHLDKLKARASEAI